MRHVDSSFGLGIAILDETEALIHYIHPDSPDLTTATTDIGVCTTEHRVVQDLASMFDFIWKHSVPIEKELQKTARRRSH